MRGIETVFIGVVPNGKILRNKKPYRSDIDGSYHKELNGAVYKCKLNGGHNKYFFVEERYYIEQPDGTWKMGNIKKIHHYNQTPEQLQINNYHATN